MGLLHFYRLFLKILTCNEEVLTWQTGDIFLTFFHSRFWNYRPCTISHSSRESVRITYYLHLEGFICTQPRILLLFLWRASVLGPISWRLVMSTIARLTASWGCLVWFEGNLKHEFQGEVSDAIWNFPTFICYDSPFFERITHHRGPSQIADLNEQDSNIVWMF